MRGISTVGKSHLSASFATVLVKQSIRGFTYVAMLISIVITAITAGSAVAVSARAAQAEREAELLFRGLAYRLAIQRYYEAGAPFKQFPMALEHLLRDPRAPSKRYLRTLYPEPFSHTLAGWTLIRATDGGIAGVVSTKQGAPLKKSGWPKGLEKFSGAQSYAEWIFHYIPPSPSGLAPTVEQKKIFKNF